MNTGNHNRRPSFQTAPSVRIAGVLLLVSMVTHLVQVFVYHELRTQIGVSAFGIAYGVIGWFLLSGSRRALIAGAVVPALGGAAGAYRLLVVQPNPFSAFHIMVDVVVIAICLYELRMRRPATRDP